MLQRNALYKELVRLNTIKHRKAESGSISTIIPPATIGFEFDLDWGASEIDPPPPSVKYIDGKLITTHTEDTDGFRLKGDGPSIEIGTKVFDITEDGRKEMNTVLGKIKALADEFETLCAAASLNKAATADDYDTNTVSGKDTRIIGKPRSIQHPTLIKNQACKNKAVRDYSIECIFPIQGQFTWYRQKLCYVRASPQATVAIPLSKIDAFVKEIKDSENLPKNKFPLSGNTAFRMGLRSDAIYIARDRVEASRRWHFTNKTKLGDGTAITESNYTSDLQGLMILMLSYLLISKIKYNVRKKNEDWEAFAKAYLPLNVKNHFRLLFKDLNAEERQVFNELYFNGTTQLNFFKLADKALYKKTVSEIKSIVSTELLFPAKADLGFEVYPERPTWFSFLDMIVNNKPLKQEKEYPYTDECKHKSDIGDEILFVPISKHVKYVKGSKRVVLEMRRIGTWMVPKEEWLKLCNRVFDLALKLNS